VRIISLPWRNYPTHLGDNLSFRLPPGLDLLIQDELNHPSLLAANRRKQYPVVSLVHHLRCSELRPAWQNAFYRFIERRYLQSVDGFIFNSQTTRGVVTDLIGDKQLGIVAYPPTDRFGAALPEAFIRARAAEPGPLRIVFLGNVIPRKGLHVLLEAIRRHPSAFWLDVIGSLKTDPAYARKMKSLAARNGGTVNRTYPSPNEDAADTPASGDEQGVSQIPYGYNAANRKSKIIHFHGPLDNLLLAEKLKAAQVLVVPSSYEGFGIVYLEGMGFGLPAIGTTAGAAGEIIRDGETGFLIAPQDAETLAARLQALAEDRGLLTRLSIQAAQRYREQPTWQQTSGEIRSFLEGMVKGK
jgi:glycosyltransferase involved in cell wall biosynthesis